MKDVIVIQERSMKGGSTRVREHLNRPLGFARSYPAQT